jgi:hypothetical protein
MTASAHRHWRGQRPGYEAPTMPTCGDCRRCEAYAGATDRCAIDGRRVTHNTPGCENYVTIRRGP